MEANNDTAIHFELLAEGRQREAEQLRLDAQQLRAQLETARKALLEIMGMYNDQYIVYRLAEKALDQIHAGQKTQIGAAGQ